ncbi:MAG: autotransporter domain-containing protein [Sutterella sp.]|nr:autotransporter domain-containing protein [Sutterella sp.]
MPQRVAEFARKPLSTLLLSALALASLTTNAFARDYTIDATHLDVPRYTVHQKGNPDLATNVRSLVLQADGTVCFQFCAESSNTEVRLDAGDVITLAAGTHLVGNEILWRPVNINANDPQPKLILESGATITSQYRKQLWLNVAFYGMDVEIKKGATYEVTNPDGATNDAHFSIQGTSTSLTGSTSVLVEGRLSVAHMLALSQGRSLLTDDRVDFHVKGGTVETIGIKMGVGNDTNVKHKTLNLSFTEGASLTITTARGLTKTEPGDARTGTKNIVATLTFNDATLHLNDSLAENYSFALSDPRNATLFRYMETNDQAHEAGYADTIAINGEKGLTIHTDGTVFVPNQYRGASFTGSGTFTKSGDNTFVITAPNANFSGKVVIADGELEIGGAGLAADLANGPYRDFGLTLSSNNPHRLAIQAALETPITYTDAPGIGSASVEVGEGGALVLSPDHTLYGTSSEVFHFNNGITGAGDLVILTKDKVLIDGIHDGQTRDFHGETRVEAGELTVSGEDTHFDNTRSLKIGSLYNGIATKVTVEENAQFRMLREGKVVIGEKGDGTLVVNRQALFAAGQIQHGANTSAGGRTKAHFLMENGSTLELTESGTFMDGFDVNRGDTIVSNGQAAGENRLSIAEGKTVTLTESGRITTTGRLVKMGQGTFELTASGLGLTTQTQSDQWDLKEGTLALGKHDGSQAYSDVVEPESRILTSGTLAESGLASATLRFNVKDTYRLAPSLFDENGNGNVNLLQAGPGTMIVDEALPIHGGMALRGGVVKLTDQGTLGDSVSAVDTGEGDAKGVFEMAQSSGERTFTRRVIGTGTLRKTGAGSVTLNDDRAHAGAHEYTPNKVEVQNGTLTLAAGNTMRADTVRVEALETPASGSPLAHLLLAGDTQVTNPIIVGSEQTLSASTNRLTLDGVTLTTAQITTERGEDLTKVVQLHFKNGAGLTVTRSGTLFAGLEGTTGTDETAIGAGGLTLTTQAGVDVTQNDAVGWMDLADTTDAGTDHFTKAGRGTLRLTARNTYSGALHLTEGTLILGKADGSSTAATATLGGQGEIVTGENTHFVVNLSDGATSQSAVLEDGNEIHQGRFVLNRAISGGASFTQAGTGTTILMEQNTYTGSTTITQGTLEVGHYSDATLGGTGAITNNGTLRYSLNHDLTLERAIVGTGSLDNRGVDGTTLTLTGENTFTGDVYATSGTLRVTSLAALGAVGKTTHLGVLDGVAPEATSLARVRSARALTPSSRIREPTTAPAPGSLVLDLAEDAVYRFATDGNGSLVKQGDGTLAFTNEYTYAHSGEMRLEGGKVVLGAGVDMPNADLRLTDGELLATPETHRVRAFHVEANEGSPKTTIFANDFTTYTNYHAAESVAIQGGELYIDLRQYEADFEATRTSNLIPNVIQTDGEMAAGSAFTSYSDSSVLFNFTPVYDVDGTLVPSVGTHAMHLVVSAEHQTTCSAPGMGAVECIVRNHAHDHAAPMAEVLDREFRDNPAGNVAQHFYSVSSESLVDEMAERGLPLMTGSLNQTLANDAQALALYSPRDPCDPTLTEHGSHLWTQLDKAWGEQDAYRGSTGYRTRSTGVALGHDVCSKDHLSRYGAYVGYRNTDVASRHTAALHSADTRLLQVGLYGDRVVAENQDIDWQVGYAHGFIKGERQLTYLGLVAKADYDANVAYAGVGYNWRGDVVSPFVRFDYTYVRSDAYHETGAGGFNYDVAAQTRHSGVASLGYQFKGHPTENLTLRGRVALGVELLDEHNTIRTAFEGIPGATFDTRSAEDERVQATLDFGLRYRVTKSVDVDLGYQALIKPDYTQQTGEARLTVTF